MFILAEYRVALVHRCNDIPYMKMYGYHTIHIFIYTDIIFVFVSQKHQHTGAWCTWLRSTAFNLQIVSGAALLFSSLSVE